MTPHKAELVKLPGDNYITQCLCAQNIAVSVQNADKEHLQELLDILNRTQDLEQQTKILNLLSAYIITNGSHVDIIVTWSPLYQKIQNILCKGLPSKTTIALNLISALLYIDEDGHSIKKRTLTAYVRHMIRVSGCLISMSNLFTGGMLYQDTRRALYRCLAESCSDSLSSQTQCSHLIPLCVQRCLQGNNEVFAVLRGLLQHHEQNIILFLQCNGTDVFTRECLQYDECVLLLNTLVKNTKAADAIGRQSDVVNHLQEISNTHGPNSQIAQLATIILSHIDSRTKDRYFLISKYNIVKEIYQQNSNGENTKAEDVKENLNFVEKSAQAYVQEKINEFITNDYEKLQNSLSFSFLMKTFLFNSKNNTEIKQFRTNFTVKRNNANTNATKINSAIYDNSTVTHSHINENSMMSYTIQKNNDSSDIDQEAFKPLLVSTPKVHIRRGKDRAEQYLKSNASRLDEKRVRGVHKPLRPPMKQPEGGRSSMSAKFFDTINESCSLMVNTFKNIFKIKDNVNIIQTDLTNERSAYNIENERNCSYSFVNRVGREYAASVVASDTGQLHSSSNSTADSVNNVHSCKTCNDTTVLKRKLANDVHLKKTIMKLKFGIRLFGCDFKKISKKLWPRETYMTHKVLYKLYRKLIVKHK